MGSWMTCICGGLIHLNMFSGTHIYQLIEDADYDAVDDPVDRDKLAELYFKKGTTVYRCLTCGRLVADWAGDGNVTFYLPELKRPEPNLTKGEHEPAAEAGAGEGEAGAGEGEAGPVDRLRELEALAEAEYGEMYDSRSPTGCYSRAKEAFYAAITLASQLGLEMEVKRLEKRLHHVKEVFRHQFS